MCVSHIFCFCAKATSDSKEHVECETGQEHGEEEERTVDECVEPDDQADNQEYEKEGDDKGGEDKDDEAEEEWEAKDEGEEQENPDEQTEYVDRLQETTDKDKTGTYKARTWGTCDPCFFHWANQFMIIQLSARTGNLC